MQEKEWLERGVGGLKNWGRYSLLLLPGRVTGLDVFKIQPFFGESIKFCFRN